MILNAKEMKNTHFLDSRGEAGSSGNLYIAETETGAKYLVKSNPVDVANEYVAHLVARKIGVPTSDAVLITDHNNIRVGIAFENDFKMVPWDDFLGKEEYESKVPIYVNGRPYKTPLPSVVKYSDDDSLLKELMAYLAFRTLIVIEDNVQIALVGGHLISFDYAESFYLTEGSFSRLLQGGGIKRQVQLFSDHLYLECGYRHSIEFLHRKDSDALLDAYLDPVFAFQDSDFGFIINELKSVFPQNVPAFYNNCFDLIKREIDRLGE